MPFDAEITTKSRDLIVLEKARERIARGWCQTELVNDAGAVCLLGALGFVDGGGDYEPSCPEAARAVTHLGFGDVEAAYTWNDIQDDVGPVLARFDAAIALLSR